MDMNDFEKIVDIIRMHCEKMKAKQLLLVQKQAQLIAMLLNIQLEYSSQLDDEVSNYNESISTIHMKIE